MLIVNYIMNNAQMMYAPVDCPIKEIYNGADLSVFLLQSVPQLPSLLNTPLNNFALQKVAKSFSHHARFRSVGLTGGRKQVRVELYHMVRTTLGIPV